MFMPAETAFAPVESQDEMDTAIQAARLHATKFYAAGRSTLVKRFTAEQVGAWDGADEMALVSDPDGVDLPDVMDHDKAA